MASKYITPADTAKEVRSALKEAFPGTKFSVRTHTYAGGASIDVQYTDGPKQKRVREVTEKFSGATFDGMTDMKAYQQKEHNGEMVRWGADFVFANRDYSPEVTKEAEEFTKFALVAEGIDPAWNGVVETPQEFHRRFGDVLDLRFEYSAYNLVSLAEDALANEAYEIAEKAA